MFLVYAYRGDGGTCVLIMTMIMVSDPADLFRSRSGHIYLINFIEKKIKNSAGLRSNFYAIHDHDQKVLLASVQDNMYILHVYRSASTNSTLMPGVYYDIMNPYGSRSGEFWWCSH